MRYIIAILLLRQAYVSKKRRKIYLLLTVLVLSLPLFSTFFYQSFYGEKNYTIIKSPETKLKIIPIDKKTTQEFRVGKYTISYEAQAEIDLRARAVYIDFNNGLFSSWDYYSNPVYDTISPVDLSVFIGSMSENWKDYRIEHERRAMFVYGDVKVGEWENLHIIPATKNVYAGLKTIRVGDIVSLKGYLINWQGTGQYNYLKIETALSFVTESKEKLGGRFTWLCMQFFATELDVRGYIYK